MSARHFAVIVCTGDHERIAIEFKTEDEVVRFTEWLEAHSKLEVIYSNDIPEGLEEV